MNNYLITIANDFNFTNSPLVFNVGVISYANTTIINYSPQLVLLNTTITFTDDSIPTPDTRLWAVGGVGVTTDDYTISSNSNQQTEIIFKNLKIFTVSLTPTRIGVNYIPPTATVTITPGAWILGDTTGKSVLGSTTILTSSSNLNQVTTDTNKITLLDPSTYRIVPINNDMTILNSNTLTTPQEGSYTIQFFDNVRTNIEPITFSFYVFDKFFNINKKILYNTITRQLPKLYQPTNKLNDIDNIASAGVIQDLYDYNYKLFWNTLVSLGTDSSYNTDHEFTYLGINNILNSAVFPAQFLKTMMNLSVYSNVKISQLAIVFSRLFFQFLGTKTNNIAIPVQIVYNSGTWDINVYNILGQVWVLGDSVKSVLGSTTILAGINSEPLLWLLNYIVNTLLPSHIKYQINFFDYDTTFKILFNVEAIGDNDFYNPVFSSTYDAFEFVNNNNSFNTKGFKLRS